MVTQSARCRIIELYRKISIEIASPRQLDLFKRFFTSRQTLGELLNWIHFKLRFNKDCPMRHNDPLEILAYGEGRCREFSVLFTTACLANGYRARLILDMSDHAWTEVWDPTQGKWIHVDPSERIINDPGMYEREWKKTLKEVYSFERGKLEEVTENYRIYHNRCPTEPDHTH